MSYLTGGDASFDTHKNHSFSAVKLSSSLVWFWANNNIDLVFTTAA